MTDLIRQTKNALANFSDDSEIMHQVNKILDNLDESLEEMDFEDDMQGEDLTKMVDHLTALMDDTVKDVEEEENKKEEEEDDIEEVDTKDDEEEDDDIVEDITEEVKKD